MCKWLKSFYDKHYYYFDIIKLFGDCGINTGTTMLLKAILNLCYGVHSEPIAVSRNIIIETIIRIIIIVSIMYIVYNNYYSLQ